MTDLSPKSSSHTVRPNSLRAWTLAARPKTLTAALVPVVVGTAFAIRAGKFDVATALLCMLFAALMQIAANFINDLYDFTKGADRADRLGPERACAQGWITPEKMRLGIAIVVVMAILVGLMLLAVSAPNEVARPGGDYWPRVWGYAMPLMMMGGLCVIFAFLYTTLLSYIGLGDVLVWLFFGFVPVLGTYYVQVHSLPLEVWLSGGACGLIIDTLLILNNYRDRDTDRAAGKRTLIAVLGEPFGRYFYLFIGIAGYVMGSIAAANGGTLALLIMLPYVSFHIWTWHAMKLIFEGKKLNQILSLTSRNILIFGILFTISILLS